MGTTRTNGIPGLPGNNNFKVMAAGARKLGYKEVHTGHVDQQPAARRPRLCQQIGFCFQGCKSGAKWSTLYTEIPKGEATGNLEVRPNSMAVQIEHDARARSPAWSMSMRTASCSGRRRASSRWRGIRWKARACC